MYIPYLSLIRQKGPLLYMQWWSRSACRCVWWCLMLSTLGNFSYFSTLGNFSYFSQKTGLSISCILFSMKTIHMKCQILVTGKIQKNFTNLCSAELAQSKVVKVEHVITLVTTKFNSDHVLCWLTLKTPVTTAAACSLKKILSIRKRI